MSGSPLFDTFARAPIAFVRGEGVWAETSDGRRVLDFGGGVAVNALGHAHPALVSALTEQAGKIWHVSNLYRVPEQEALGEKLVAESFADKVFFCNSGAEAIEGALKTGAALITTSAATRSEGARHHFCSGAFHGRTLTTLSATGQPEVPGRLRSCRLKASTTYPLGNMNELRHDAIRAGNGGR